MRDLVCWYGIWLVFAYSFAMWPLKPWLIGTNPVLLAVLTGDQSTMTVAGAFARVGETPYVLTLIAGTVGMMKFAWVFWLAGRLWGGNLVRLLAGPPDERKKRSRNLLARETPANRRVIAAAVVLAPLPLIPSALAFASAGWVGMSLTTFLVLNLIGSAAWAGMFTGLGFAIGSPAVRMAERVTDYAVWVSLAIVAAMLLMRLTVSLRAAGKSS
ncbi:VTT domain-containing protein [Streptomyces lunaelactis]|uniref:DedA family protein n=1 Tax=Streptomyces lunaelactis TaxID=1535768 RepID=UPI001585CB9C|nr:VTT domain-containing protein [Streptomyces lunaelactis]NUK03214.1 VTT domain-containing protein [Streptomyces lunaelactis]NUK17542.1 VTT domain-containing protein [Streptomyces lunaelactis]NUK26586.1 VTT domain-containing protein [Streptomyces lunaelactis]NUK52475.1 VTT domain-containing protein [Streptomyces lunaelactis]NUK66196.1 VTT domain-containing protein [Streptomyces lunaelactis]